MKILTVFIHYPISSGRYVTEAFKNLGHEVRHIGDSTGGRIWDMSVDPKYVHESNGDLTTHWDDWKPDLIVILESAWKYHHPVYQDVPHVIFGMDNHVRDYLQAGVERYFVAHKAVSVMDFDPYAYPSPSLPEEMIDRKPFIEWLPCATSNAFQPSQIPYADREYDVCVVGVDYPHRRAAVDALVKAGLKVYAATGLLFEDYAAAYHNARVSLCLSAAKDVGQRIFETAALGCAVVTDDCPDFKELQPPGIYILDDEKTLVKEVKAVLSDPETPRMIELSTAWALGETWERRAEVIIRWYQENYGDTSADIPTVTMWEKPLTDDEIEEIAKRPSMEVKPQPVTVLEPIPADEFGSSVATIQPTIEPNAVISLEQLKAQVDWIDELDDESAE